MVIKVAQTIGDVMSSGIYHAGDWGDLMIVSVIEQMRMELPLLLD